MLPSHIVEELLRRERSEDRRREPAQPELRLPLPEPAPMRSEQPPREPRGAAIISIYG